jgi:single-strand DNA-binding protein|nr:MAG TPA: Single strand binding protein [Caudoviricetes sp.]
MGRLTKDVEMRQTPNGVSLARFSIAVTRRFKNSNGEYDADFINCVAWRQTGEFIARYFQKGSMIAIVGSIQTRSWDGNDGKKQYATEVIVDEAYFTGSKSESSTGGNTDLSDSSIDDLNSQYGDDFATIGDEEDLPF